MLSPLLSPLLDRIRIVLVSTSHPGNIGAAARAIKTMGLTRLILVAPRAANPHADREALALATGADDVLRAALIVPTLDEALSGCVWAAAMTARTRELAPPATDPRGAAAQAIELTAGGQDIAFVFGNEQHGLDNADVLKCQTCCAIPTRPDFWSLNLSQAVQVIAYECRQAALARDAVALLDAADVVDNAASRTPLALASHEAREQFFTHLEEALIHCDFLDPAHPKKLMTRMRRMFARTALEQEEVALLRGICTAILKSTPGKP